MSSLNKKSKFLYSESQLKKNIILYGSGGIANEFFLKFKRYENLMIVDDYNYGKFFKFKNFKFKIHHPKIIKKFTDHQIILTTRYIDSVKPKLKGLDYHICFIDFQKNNFFKFTKNKNDKIKVIRKYLNGDSLELFNKIIQIKIKKKNINILHNYLIKKPFGRQYQSFLPKKISTFLDLGFYDGLTSYEFLRLFSKIKEIIAIEPFALKKNIFIKFLKKKTKFRHLKIAASNLKKIGKIYIDSTPSANSVKFKTNKFKIINFERLDSKIKKLEDSSFVKFDIEGGELDALKGMSKIILNFKPYMAVSIYHGDNDFYEIPYYLIKRYKDIYNFKIRHYSYGYNETVLYALPK